VLTALSPLLRVDLRAPWATHIVASDASPFAAGVVSTPLCVHACYTRCGHSQPHICRPYSSSARMGSCLWCHTACSARACPSLLCDFSVQQAVQPTRWFTLVPALWQRDGHINCLESEALQLGLRWYAPRPSSIGARLPPTARFVGRILHHTSRSHQLFTAAHCSPSNCSSHTRVICNAGAHVAAITSQPRQHSVTEHNNKCLWPSGSQTLTISTYTASSTLSPSSLPRPPLTPLPSPATPPTVVTAVATYQSPSSTGVCSGTSASSTIRNCGRPTASSPSTPCASVHAAARATRQVARHRGAAERVASCGAVCVSRSSHLATYHRDRAHDGCQWLFAVRCCGIGCI